MIPTFFHLESHLWIAYVLLLNGYLANLFLRRLSSDYHQMTTLLEAQVLAAFFISVTLNGLLLLILQSLSQKYSLASYVLPAITLGLALLVVRGGPDIKRCMSVEIDWLRCSMYVVVFVVLFYNGGLIEQISDAWWHMSLANKIALASSYSLETGHLTGLPTRYYPPLWHGNLAMLHILSAEPLPIIWNSFTAWGATFKVMALFLFALALTKDKFTAGLAALFFVLLPGIGNSYLRVSAWPSHIAYTAWFVLLGLVFRVFDARDVNSGGVRVLHWWNKRSLMAIGVALPLMIIIYFSHKLELLWFALAIYFYFLALMVRYVWNGEVHQIEPAYPLLFLFGGAATLGWVGYAGYFFLDQFDRASIDERISFAFAPILAVVFFLLSGFRSRLPMWAVRASLVVLLAAIVWTIDPRHALSLFVPELAYPPQATPQSPLAAPGLFGENLKIPGWHLQLREGLLFSGSVAAGISLIMAIFTPNRINLFLSANCLVALMFCFSPYLYHWLAELLNYHSPWRIAILVWHPLIIAVCVSQLLKFSRGDRR